MKDHYLKVPVDAIEGTPNDADLGELVRAQYIELTGGTLEGEIYIETTYQDGKKERPMAVVNGRHIPVVTPILKKFIGQKVKGKVRHINSIPHFVMLEDELNLSGEPSKAEKMEEKLKQSLFPTYDEMEEMIKDDNWIDARFGNGWIDHAKNFYTVDQVYELALMNGRRLTIIRDIIKKLGL